MRKKAISLTNRKICRGGESREGHPSKLKERLRRPSEASESKVSVVFKFMDFSCLNFYLFFIGKNAAKES